MEGDQTQAWKDKKRTRGTLMILGRTVNPEPKPQHSTLKEYRTLLK